MRDRRAQRCLVHTTLGFPSAITPENAEEILLEIRRSTATEIEQAAREREEVIKREYEDTRGDTLCWLFNFYGNY